MLFSIPDGCKQSVSASPATKQTKPATAAVAMPSAVAALPKAVQKKIYFR